MEIIFKPLVQSVFTVSLWSCSRERVAVGGWVDAESSEHFRMFRTVSSWFRWLQA